MKKILFASTLLSAVVGVNAHAVLFYCEGNEQKLTFTASESSTCLSGLQLKQKSTNYCISRISKALPEIEVGKLYQSCTEFGQDGSGKWVARVNRVLPFGAE